MGLRSGRLAASSDGPRPGPLTPAWVAMIVLAGLAFGVVVAVVPDGTILAAVGLLAIVAVMAMVRRPPVVPAVFWLAFSLQRTLFYGFQVTGLYYPVYLLMAANAVLAAMLGRLRLDLSVLWPYLLFLVSVLVSLLVVPEPLDFDGYQRLFAYAMGLLVFIQFVQQGGATLMKGVQLVAALTIAVWVIANSVGTGFADRAGLDVDQNDVSFLVGFGLLVLLSRLMAPGLGRRGRILAWLGLAFMTYAMLLLASRGVSLAFFAAASVMYARILLDARRSIPILVIAVLSALLLLTLPGSDALLERFSGADVSTANDRVPLWRGAIDAYTSGSLREVLLGQGFGASERVASNVTATLTSTHNAYLQLLVDLGLFGALAFVALHVNLFVRFWRGRSAAALYGSGVVLFMALADLSLNIPDFFVYWVGIGFLMALAADAGNGPTRRPMAPRRPPAPRVVPIATPDGDPAQ